MCMNPTGIKDFSSATIRDPPLKRKMTKGKL